jgi:hypothetical protein
MELRNRNNIFTAIISILLMLTGTSDAYSSNKLDKDQLSTATAMLNVVNVIERLSYPVMRISYAGAYDLNQDQTDYRIVIDRCGYVGCRPWKELRIGEDRTPLKADRQIKYEGKFLNLSEIPFNPVSEYFTDALTALLRVPSGLKETSARANRIVSASVDRSGNKITYTFGLSKEVPQHETIFPGSLVVLEDRSSGESAFEYSLRLAAAINGNAASFRNEGFMSEGVVSKTFDIVEECNQSGLAQLETQAKDAAQLKAQETCDGQAYRTTTWALEKKCLSTIEGIAKAKATFRCR